MAMTREEERELRMNCSIGSLLGNLSSREDLKKPPPEDTSSKEGGKRGAEDQKGGKSKKAKDAEESRAIEWFTDETPDIDEDDPDWVKEEKQFLLDEYGRKIVTLSFGDNDRFIYTCEICNINANARTMIQAHCIGMKHLKRVSQLLPPQNVDDTGCGGHPKKALLDRKLQGKDVPDTFKVTKSTGPKTTKPSSTVKPKEPDEKKKWNAKNAYFAAGGYNQPPPFPPPGFPAGAPGFPPNGPPPNFFGPWGAPPSSTPNMFSTPPPNVEGKTTGKDSLAGGDTGSLLQKLADCAVKNDKDSELAINVVIALMKSLKDFNHKRGETKFIEVLTEADVTFRVLKTLKPVNKETSDTPPAAGTPDQVHDSASSVVADYQEAPPASQASSYGHDNQYSQNTTNGDYNYGNGSAYSTPTPVPPPSNNYNARPANTYGQDGSSQNYNQGPPAYSNQPPNNSYPSTDQSYGYGSQGSAYYDPSQETPSNNYYPGTSYPPAPGTTPNNQASTTGAKIASVNNSLVPPPPPPPPVSAAAPDATAPDFSNYGYAAGYSMGYYSVPPPAYNQPY